MLGLLGLEAGACGGGCTRNSDCPWDSTCRMGLCQASGQDGGTSIDATVPMPPLDAGEAEGDAALDGDAAQTSSE
ncbi:MAG: hypothetical protein OXR73_28610 [Myxococcales bacterium]|nr:hypothetical protein [Myxococcales bacterium]